MLPKYINVKETQKTANAFVWSFLAMLPIWVAFFIGMFLVIPR